MKHAVSVEMPRRATVWRGGRVSCAGFPRGRPLPLRPAVPPQRHRTDRRGSAARRARCTTRSATGSSAGLPSARRPEVREERAAVEPSWPASSTWRTGTTSMTWATCAFHVRRFPAIRVWAAVQPPGGKTVPHRPDQRSAGLSTTAGRSCPAPRPSRDEAGHGCGPSSSGSRNRCRAWRSRRRSNKRRESRY